jgi:hypothetical protein
MPEARSRRLSKAGQLLSWKERPFLELAETFRNARGRVLGHGSQWNEFIKAFLKLIDVKAKYIKVAVFENKKRPIITGYVSDSLCYLGSFQFHLLFCSTRLIAGSIKSKEITIDLF